MDTRVSFQSSSSRWFLVFKNSALSFPVYPWHIYSKNWKLHLKLATSGVFKFDYRSRLPEELEMGIPSGIPFGLLFCPYFLPWQSLPVHPFNLSLHPHMLLILLMKVTHQCTWQKRFKCGEEFFFSKSGYTYLQKRLESLDTLQEPLNIFLQQKFQPRCSITQVCFQRGNKETNFIRTGQNLKAINGDRSKDFTSFYY